MFKIQASIFTSESGPQQVLVYNQDRSVLWEGDITPEVRSMMDGRQKIYVLGHVSETGKIVIARETHERSW